MRENLEYARDLRQMGASFKVINNALKQRGVNFFSRLVIIQRVKSLKKSHDFSDRHLFLLSTLQLILIISPITFFFTKVIAWYLYDINSFFEFFPYIMTVILYSLAFSFILRTVYLQAKQGFHNGFVSYGVDVLIGFVFGMIALSGSFNLFFLGLMFSFTIGFLLITLYGLDIEASVFSAIFLFGVLVILNFSFAQVSELLYSYAPVIRAYLDSLGLERYSFNWETLQA